MDIRLDILELIVLLNNCDSYAYSQQLVDYLKHFLDCFILFYLGLHKLADN